MNLIRSGYYERSTGDINVRSSNGYYWAPSPYFAADARTLYFTSTNLYPQSSYYKGNGFSVRCLGR